MNYHAHVYWQNKEQQQVAVSLRYLLAEAGCGLGRVWDRSVGPHPLPMYQINYNDRLKDSVETLLRESGLVVLLHEDTGDDLRDHTTGARWLGEVLELNLEWLRVYSELK